MATVVYDRLVHCRTCKGEGCFIWPEQNIAPPVCDYCNGTGDIITYFETVIKDMKAYFAHERNDLQEERQELLDWIEKTSICSTCCGNRGNTIYSWPCKECGLTGRQPIGG